MQNSSAVDPWKIQLINILFIKCIQYSYNKIIYSKGNIKKIITEKIYLQDCIVLIEKYPCIGRQCKFKPMLFKDQLYSLTVMFYVDFLKRKLCFILCFNIYLYI